MAKDFKIKREREEYLQKKENFYRRLEEASERENGEGESEIDRAKIDEILVDIFTDLNSDIENGSSGTGIMKQLDKSLKVFCN